MAYAWCCEKHRAAAPHRHAPLHGLWLVRGRLSAACAEFAGPGLAQTFGAARCRWLHRLQEVRAPMSFWRDRHGPIGASQAVNDGVMWTFKTSGLCDASHAAEINVMPIGVKALGTAPRRGGRTGAIFRWKTPWRRRLPTPHGSGDLSADWPHASGCGARA